MKPKTIDEILDDVFHGSIGNEKARDQLLDLFMSCVPEEIKPIVEGMRGEGWNDCREQMIKNLEKLK